MDAISKGWQCQEYGFMEVKRYPEDRVRHFKADRPIIRINFSEDLQQESVNNESFKVGYPDAEGEFITVTGRFINDKSKIQFVPDKGLRKGVRYTVKLKVGEQGVRSARGVFIDDDSGTGWHESEFWTSLPFANQNDESSGLSCDVYQTVKNAPLILGKPALMKVYADWPRLDDVHTSAQYREFDAKILNNSNDRSPVNHRFTRPDLMEGWGKSVLREKEAAQYTSYSFKCPKVAWDRKPVLTVDVLVIDPDDVNYAHQSNGQGGESFKRLERSAFETLLDKYLQDATEFAEQLYPISKIQFSAPRYVALPDSAFENSERWLTQLTNPNSKADVQAVILPHEITNGGGSAKVLLSSTKNLDHTPYFEGIINQDAYDALWYAREGNTQKYEGLDGMRISKDGSLWWHKSSRLGNEESKHIAPLMYPFTLDTKDVVILRHHYRQVQSLLEDLSK